MSDIFLNFHYDKYFREVDLTKYEKTVISIGKSAKCDIVINSDALNDKEVILKKEDGVWYIIDISGRGITYKNQAIPKKNINHGNIFLIGRDIKDERGGYSRVAIIAKTIENYNTMVKKVYFEGMAQIAIGKDPSNNVIYMNALVSSHHAKIIFRDNDYYILDSSSVNGIYVNGTICRKSILKSGDTIVIGGFKIVFHSAYLALFHSGKELHVNGFRQVEDERVVRNVTQTIFMRSPRLRAEMPKGDVEVLNPPQEPSKPQMSWLATLLPPILMGTSMLVISRVSGYNNPIYVAATMLVSFGTIPISLTTYFSQKKKYKKDCENRLNRYTEYINKLRNDFDEKREQQKNIMYEIHPDIENCVKRAVNRDRRLWERAVQYEDFLSIRLGIGTDDFRLNIRFPRQEFRFDNDDLFDKPKELHDEFFQIKNVPICIPLAELSTVGFLGNRNDVLAFSKSLAIQIATHHSYDEVKIVAIFPPGEGENWKWLKWLPHVWDETRQMRYLADDKENAQVILSRMYDIFKQREFDNHEKTDERRTHSPHYVFILADMSMLENQPILSYLIYNKKNLALTSLFFFDRLELLPKDCQAIVELEGTNGNMYTIDNTSQVKSFVIDKIDLNISEKFSRKMASIRIKQMLSSTDLPTNVPLLDVFDVKSVESLNISNRWVSNMPYRTMAAPIGIRLGGEKLYLDLHEKSHGPHGLVAGTTGSGKSEILQTFIISMAINFHPHDVGFVIIDYKGGGMANAFEKLPHLLGTITNLGGNQTKRAMICIYSEIKKRQRYFEKYSVNHIDAYQKMSKADRTMEPLPHLIIVADEFAELKADNPEFIDDLVSAARVGRSLGVHLILATQKPSGVVNDQIWSNSRFKLCLKVQDADDSREMLKRTDAANIKEPGRSYLQVGNNEIFELFQSAYSGAPYDPDANTQEEDYIDIYSVDLNGRRVKCNETEKITRRPDTKNQLEVAIDYINRTMNTLNIKKLKNVWPDLLPENLLLGSVIDRNSIWSSSGWKEQRKYLNISVGLSDFPAMQIQESLAIDFEEAAHLAVVGGPGGGKTTFLNTLITSAALSYSPENLNFYILDFGTRTLGMFTKLPHVGGVVMSDEDVKLSKLSKFILKEMDRRKRLFSTVGISNIVSYRKGTGKILPSILLVVDNTVALYDMYDYMVDDLAQVSREGSNLGIHLVLTANDINGIGYKIVGNIKMVCAIQLTDKADYVNTVGSSYGLYPAEAKGRGLVKGNPALEFQTALVCKGDTEVDRADNLKSLISEVGNSWSGARAKEIPIMPDLVSMEYLIEKAKEFKYDSNNYGVAIGLDSENIEPVYLDMLDTGSFVIAGTSMSGKTNMIKSWITGLAEQLSPDEIEIYVVDSNAYALYALKELPHVKSYISNNDELVMVMEDFKKEYDRRKELLTQMRMQGAGNNELPDNEKKMVFVVDDVIDFTKNVEDEVKEFWENIIKRERRLGIYIAAAGIAGDIISSYTDILLMAIKEMKSGFLFGAPAEHSILNINLPYSEMSKQLKPGECYFVNKNKVTKLMSGFIE